MLGPEGVRASATELWERVYEGYQCLAGWRKALIRGDHEPAEQARVEWEGLSRMGNLHSAFLRAVTAAVADPTAAQSGISPVPRA